VYVKYQNRFKNCKKRRYNTAHYFTVCGRRLLSHIVPVLAMNYRGVHRVMVGKHEGKGPLGRPRRRWDDNIKMDLQEVGGGSWGLDGVG
jgi:hypothetical protein